MPSIFFNMAFFVVLVSLMVQGWTVNASARRLGLALRRTAPAVTRIELDIPGQVGQEMVGYPVSPESMVLGLTRLPGWARLIMVVRDNNVLSPEEAGDLHAGDYAYFLIPPDRIPRLDRLFGGTADLARRMAPLFGELSIKGESALADVAELYDLEVPAEDRDKSVAEYLRGPYPRPARSPATACRWAAPRWWRAMSMTTRWCVPACSSRSCSTPSSPAPWPSPPAPDLAGRAALARAPAPPPRPGQGAVKRGCLRSSRVACLRLHVV
jgi:hypothetical protein